MNKILIPFFTILFCLTSSFGWSMEYKDLVERDGIYYKKFSNVPFTGKVTGKGQGFVKNGKREGSWVVYHENGQLKRKGNYKNGKEEGSVVEYYKSGQLFLKFYYKNDRPEGPSFVYHYNGMLSQKANYKNGKAEGFWFNYYKNGKLESKVNYKNSIVKSTVGYDENGNILYCYKCNNN